MPNPTIPSFLLPPAALVALLFGAPAASAPTTLVASLSGGAEVPGPGDADGVGTVTLTGFIDSYAGKLAAERAAKRVKRVRAVADDIEVRLKIERTDADIAADVVRALELRSSVPSTTGTA